MSINYVSVIVIIDPKLKGPVSVPRQLNVRRYLVSMQNIECASLVMKACWMQKKINASDITRLPSIATIR